MSEPDHVLEAERHWTPTTTTSRLEAEARALHAEALTLAMLEQAIADREPWVYSPVGARSCFYCAGAVEHLSTCLWQRCRYAKYREALVDTPDWRGYAPNDGPSRIRGMWWHKPPDWELAQNGKGRASVWLNGSWHTWDKDGIGGENAREDSVEAAKAAAEEAIVRQGWGRWLK